MEGHVNTYQGMNKDMGYDVIPANLYIDAVDIRITTDSGESMGSFINIKGNKFQLSIPNEFDPNDKFPYWFATNPVPIGYTTIRNTIILFVADDSNSKGWIYTLDYDVYSREVTALKLVYYSDRLYFKKEWPIEALGRFESDTIQRVYWTDYNNYLRSINIKAPNLQNLTPDVLDSFPSNNYVLPVLKNIIAGGALKVGNYQFAYKLRSDDGKETLISPPSDMIPISKTNEGANSTLFTGGVKGEIANKALVISIDTSFYVQNYKDIVLYAIFHEDYSGTPQVIEVETKEIIGNTIEFTYTGQEEGSTVVSSLYYTIKSYPFKTCKTLTQKDNSLVISNLRYNKFSIQDYLPQGQTFESRIARYNSTGNVAHAVVGSTIQQENAKMKNAFNEEYNLDAQWDLNWFNNKQYKYQNNGSRLGGEGPNISFNFTLNKFILDVSSTATNSNGDYLYPTAIVSNTPDYLDHSYYVGQPNNSSNNTLYPNMASPFNAGVFKGYKRGDTYRFGIVFYNKKGEASYVNFIGDIKFPDVSEPDSVNNDSGTPFWPLSTEVNGITYGYNLGIEFQVDFSSCPALESEIESYQIVRLERTLADKRRITTGHFFTSKAQAIGTKDPGLAFDFHPPGQNGDNIAHINSSGNLKELKSTSPEVAKGYGAYTSADFLYNWDNYREKIPSINNLHYLVVGGVKSTAIFGWVKKLRDASAEMLAAISQEIVHKYSETIPVKSYIDTPIEYVKKAEEKRFISCNHNTQYNDTVVSFNSGNYFLRNYRVESPNELNRPLGNGVIARHASSLLSRNLAVTKDPITNNPISFASTNAEFASTIEYVDPNNNIPGSLGDIGINLVDLISPKKEIYGGFTQSILEANTFIMCSTIIPKTVSTAKVFGGDMFINMLPLQKNTYDFSEYLYKDGAANKGYNRATGVTYYIPCESHINIDLAYGATAKYSCTFAHTSGEQHIMYLQETNNLPGSVARSTAMYSYNEVYSRDNRDSAFFVQPISQATQNIKGTNDLRSFLSNVKINEEKIDSWSKFGANNFYDVDDYGPINKIINWRDQVFFFQDKAIGVFAINRAAITSTNDGVPTELGTGQGFGKHQYISKEHGTIHQYGVVSSERGIYVFDALTRKFLMIGEGVNPMSELLGMHSFVQALSPSIFLRKEQGGDNAILGKGVSFIKDHINDEIIFTFLGFDINSRLAVNTSYNIGDIIKVPSTVAGVPYFYYQVHTAFISSITMGGATQDVVNNATPIARQSVEKASTIVLDENMGQFSSRYSATPRFWFGNQDVLMSTDTNKLENIYTHNIGNWGEFYGKIQEASITLILNPSADVNKILRFLEFNSIVRDENKVIDRSRTITAFDISTEIGTTGKTGFSPDRIKRRFDKWRIKIPRDANSKNQKGRLRSTYFIVTLYFDNQSNQELIMNKLLSYHDAQIF